MSPKNGFRSKYVKTEPGSASRVLRTKATSQAPSTLFLYLLIPYFFSGKTNHPLSHPIDTHTHTQKSTSNTREERSVPVSGPLLVFQKRDESLVSQRQRRFNSRKHRGRVWGLPLVSPAASLEGRPSPRIKGNHSNPSKREGSREKHVPNSLEASNHRICF